MLPGHEMAAGVLQVNASGARLSFTGVTPGARLALVGVAARSTNGWPSKQNAAEILVDDDANGAIDYAPPGGIPGRSVWAATDVATGAVVAVAPAGYALDHRELPQKALKKDPDGLVAALVLDLLRVDLLLVRPGEGVWILRLREGGAGDRDGIQDGRITLRFEDASALDGVMPKAPKKLKAGDVVTMIDPTRLQVRTLTVAY